MFLTRCKDTSKKNTLYYTSAAVRDVVQSNEDRVKIINTGVKAFAKCENKGAQCAYRLAQEGALMTIPFMGRRIVHTTRDDFGKLLSFSDFDNPPSISILDQETQDVVHSLPTGSIALVYDQTRNGTILI